MKFDFTPVDMETCILELYKYDISIELTTFEARMIEFNGLIHKFNTDFIVPSLSMVRILQDTPVLHTAFDGMITPTELSLLTQKHIKRVLYALER